MKFTPLFSILLITFILAACSSSPKDNPVLKEAYGIHQESMKIHDEVADLLSRGDGIVKEIETLISNGIPNGGDGDATAEDSIANVTPYKSAANKITALKAAFGEWDESLAGVPGFEEAHHHHDHAEGEGHDHDHGDMSEKLKGLPPADILKMQKEINSTIKDLKTKLGTALDEAQSILNAG